MRQVPILMYHWFRPAGEPSRSRSPQLEIEPALFDRQIAALAARGYRTVPLDEVLAGRKSPGSIVITFDDGTRDFWEHARPTLQRHGFTATLFVVTGHVGGMSEWDAALGEPPRPLLDWEQIGALYAGGFEIGSHTHRHRELTALDDAAAEEELALSREVLAQRLGRPPRFLAWPRGAYHERHKRLARHVGYDGACAVILGLDDLWRSDPYNLKRMTIKGTEAMGRFGLRVLLAHRVRFDAAGPAAAP
jgi:peptidoglycan/xylan/chitin deacetylase (PgdA/CDA1 family)